MQGDETSTLDAQTIAKQLRPAMPSVINVAEALRFSTEVSERSLTRMALNECGGLPGLPFAKRGIFRRLVNKLHRRKTFTFLQ